MRKFLIVLGVCAGFALGYGAVTLAYPAVGMYGRAHHDGYFQGVHDDVGDRIWPGLYAGEAIPAYVDTAQEFIDFVNSKLAATHFSQDNVGASFLIQTMINDSANTTPTRDWPPTAAQQADWESRIRLAESEGRIIWRSPNYSYTLNSFYQGAPSGPNPWDDAFYDNSGTAPAILFGDGVGGGFGSVVFAIKWLCANPVGNGGLGPLKKPSNYNLSPTIDVTVNGVPSIGNVAEPGDTVTYTYKVNNTAIGASSGTTCAIYGLSRTGFYTIPSPNDTTSDAGYTPPAPMTCPPSFPGSTLTTVATETISGAAVAANKSLCRTLWINQATPGGPAATDEKCAYVRNKPYARVYNGDVMAGGGLETSPGVCPTNNASIIGWNKRTAGAAVDNWSGAGTMYAAMALGTIFDTASASDNNGATKPTGLSFSNIGTNAANGQFGGNFGSVPCMKDYWATKPASTLPFTSGTSLPIPGPGTYAYAASGNVTVHNTLINTGVRVTLYVDGNLYIDGGLSYNGGGTWTVATIPMLRVIVRGNIFIDPSVFSLNGLFVAQPDAAGNNGIMYTCTNPADPFTPINLGVGTTLASTCGTNRLAFLGAVVVRQIQLLRTRGTVGKATANEAVFSANLTESFTYNPIIWIAQPNDQQTGGQYDAINSLPPVL